MLKKQSFVEKRRGEKIKQSEKQVNLKKRKATFA